MPRQPWELRDIFLRSKIKFGMIDFSTWRFVILCFLMLIAYQHDGSNTAEGTRPGVQGEGCLLYHWPPAPIHQWAMANLTPVAIEVPNRLSHTHSE